MKRKTRIYLGAGAVSLAIIFNDVTGNDFLDSVGLGKLACALDPSCRNLTEGEIAVGRSVFGGQLDYKNLRVHYRPGYHYLFRPFGDFIGFAPSQRSIYIMTPWFHSADYSKEPLEKKKHFVHELAHNWQRATRRANYFTPLKLLFAHRGHYAQAYRYPPVMYSTFRSMNFEQQASVIEAYYAIRELSKDIADNPITYKNPIAARWLGYQRRITYYYQCARLPAYERLLERHLPITRTAHCAGIKGL